MNKRETSDVGSSKQAESPESETFETRIEAEAFDEHYQSGIVSGAVMVGGSLGGAIVGITPVIGYGAGAMGFEMALLWQIGFIVMCAAMALVGVVVRD